ncbi:MAG: prolyl oligopeptidase family serine peptidase [Bacteroidota bacterium]
MDENHVFTSDCRAMFLKKPDSLGVLELGTEKISWLPGVRSFHYADEGNLLAYQSDDNRLTVRNLSGNGKHTYPHVQDYLFSKNGHTLITQTAENKEDRTTYSLQWIDMATGKSSMIGLGFKAGSLAFNETGDRLAFFSEGDKDDNNTALRFFKPGMDSAAIVLGPRATGMDNMHISNDGWEGGKNALYFSKDNSRLFFFLHPLPVSVNVRSEGQPTVNIWNYKDSLPHLALGSETGKKYAVAVSLNGRAIGLFRLQQAGEEIEHQVLKNEDYIIVSKDNWAAQKRLGLISYNPEKCLLKDIFLVSRKDGSRKKILSEVRDFDFYLMGDHVIWFDYEIKHWYSYRISKGIIKDITKRVPVTFYDEDFTRETAIDPFGIAGWLKAENKVLLYDRYDVWEVDLDGIQPAMNITKGYGRKHSVILRRFYPDLEKDNDDHWADTIDTLWLTGLNTINKDRGFFFQLLNPASDLKTRSTGPYRYARPNVSTKFRIPAGGVKAENSQTTLVTRMNAVHCPNLYYTTDYQSFTQITDLNPQQKDYNWYTDEVIRWNLPDGKAAEGTLYKPEDFDPSKRYPVIFTYYEEDPFVVNQYIAPAVSYFDLNISWFTSRGYLVFRPSIQLYKPGYPGQSAADYVISAAKFLSKKSWVDSKKMGLKGYSFGAFETNYIVTHSHLFAAAIPCEGASDLFSAASSARFGNGDGQDFHMTSQGRIRKPVWEAPERYLANSSLFRAKEVTTPLLIVQNKEDFNVPWNQGFRWYFALKSLGKKVWLLEYDGEDHSLAQRPNQIDFTIRMTQFFDHYLKGAPSPKWMTEESSESAKLKNLYKLNSAK